MVQFHWINCFDTLIDTKVYLFHVEHHVRGIVTELSVRKGNTNNKSHIFLETEACNQYNWMTQNRPVATVKEKWEKERGLMACPRKFCLRCTPSRTSDNVLLEHEICCCLHWSSHSEGNSCSYLETKCEYAMLTHHFSVICLLSNARNKISL